MGRIAVISEHASPLACVGGVDAGGQNIYVAHTALQLAARGIDVDVFTRRDDPALPDTVQWNERVRVIHVPAGPATFVRKEELLPFMDAFAQFVCAWVAGASGAGGERHVHDCPYDLMHAHFFMSALVAMRVKARLGLPYVVTFHALGKVRAMHQANDSFPPQRIDIERAVVDDADGIVAECPQDRDDLERLYDADPRKIEMIPCGFEPDEMRPCDRAEARAHLGLPADGRVLLQLGRLVPRKGIDTAILALSELSREHGLEAQLLIVGGDSDVPDPTITPEIGRLKTIAHEAGVDDRVTFTGRKQREELRYYYSAADFFITTPWYEPFGITPVESMACGTPVIGSRVGGIQYSVREGQTGFLIAPRDHPALARRLAHLYSDPSIRSFLSKQARLRANQLFTWKTITSSLLDFYRAVSQPVVAEVSNVGVRPGGL